jgi:hypothetical protein
LSSLLSSSAPSLPAVALGTDRSLRETKLTLSALPEGDKAVVLTVDARANTVFRAMEHVEDDGVR